MTRILIIDDNQDLMEIFVLMLTSCGYDIVTARSGDDGIMLMRAGDVPDLILLDIMMEPVDGWDTLRQIRDDPNPAIASVPVVMLSGKPPTVQDMKAFGGRISGYILKPVTRKALDEYISSIFRREEEFHENIRQAQKAGVSAEHADDYAAVVREIEVLQELVKIHGSIDRNMMAVLEDAERRLSAFRPET